MFSKKNKEERLTLCFVRGAFFSLSCFPREMNKSTGGPVRSRDCAWSACVFALLASVSFAVVDPGRLRQSISPLELDND